MSTPISDSNQFNAWIRSALFTVTSLAAAVAQVQHLAAQDGPIQVPRVTITLVHQCDIPARDAGMLADITIREGQAVTKSTVVAILENEQQTLNLKAAELNVRVAEMKANNELAITAAKTQLQEAKSGRRVKEVGLEIATAEADSDIAVQVAAADTKLRELELERAENARESFKGSISASQLDRLKTAVEKGQL